ncbi:MAG: ArsR/SmtB family transcription factor [Devosia sp.]
MIRMESIFKALADDTRRRLLDALLAEDGQSLGALERKFGMSRFGIAKHLRILEAAGVVVTRRQGREKLHFLNPVPIQSVYDRWVTRYAAPLSSALTRLKDQLESQTMRKEFEIYIKTTPEKLWDALTNPAVRGKYQFGVLLESEFTTGSDYRGVGRGQVIFDGKNLEVSPPFRLVQSFNAHWSDDVKAAGTSRVTIEITQVEDSCRLVVTHDDLPEGANPQLYGGWPMVLSGLKTLLETGQTLTTPMSIQYA